MAVILTWEDLDEHIDKGDLSEWLAEERAKDKARQLSEQADTPQTDYSYIEDRSKWTFTEEPTTTAGTDCSWK